MIDEERVLEHRARALSPDHPVIRGTAQNPDVYFQARETVNPFYAACPEIVQQTMDRFAELTGRQYRLFEYHGAPDAERVIVLMGSGCEAAHETVDFLNARGEKVGVLKVRLYRPFDARRFVEALPKTASAIAVLDRTKEPGCGGEPLYLDCVNALYEESRSELRVVGGRYGLSSKEFTPAMIKAVFDNLAQAIAEESFHGRHRRRSFAHQSRFRPRVLHRAGRRRSRAVLRTRFGRNGRREQGVDQNHRREHGQFRAGLFRLRLEEIRRDDDFASALRAAADPVHVSHQRGELRRLPSTVPARNERCAQGSRAGRNVSAQFRLRRGCESGDICRKMRSGD